MQNHPRQLNGSLPFDRVEPAHRLQQTLLASSAGAHFAVDACCALCAALLLSSWGVSPAEFYKLVMLYNLVAFGSQPLFGWLLDLGKCQREGMITGVLLTAAGCVVAVGSLVPAVLLLGSGNALFHVGAGAGIYTMSEGKAAPSGVFVAPGAVGLFAGGALGATSWLSPYYAAIALLLIAWGLLRIPVAGLQLATERNHIIQRPRTSYCCIVLLLLLLVVASRSFIGFSLPVPWKGMGGASLMLLAMAFAGKSLGGYLVDRIGWTISCSALLLLMSVLAVFYQHSFAAACISLFCVQATTGVTLVATQSLFPGFPAFSFGLPCVALLAGGYPYLKSQPAALLNPLWITGAGLCAAVAVLAALIIRNRKGLVHASS
jgi:MFS transporter, FSR family, fosmidomycin resistance protein